MTSQYQEESQRNLPIHMETSNKLLDSYKFIILPYWKIGELQVGILLLVDFKERECMEFFIGVHDSIGMRKAWNMTSFSFSFEQIEKKSLRIISMILDRLFGLGSRH